MKLSIITINYNNLAGLRKTVASVLAQTWRDFEWIIVDGGSTDGSKEYIEQLAQDLAQGVLPNSLTPSLPNSLASSPWRVAHFSNPSYTAQDPSTNHPVILSSNHPSSPIPHPSSHSLFWCSEKDFGIYNAMNKGIAMASGEYLNFMNSGDCFCESDILERVLPELKQDDIIYGDQRYVSDKWTYVDKYPSELTLHYFLCRSIGHASSFIKAPLLKIDGYREDFKISSDGFAFFKWKLGDRSFRHIDLVVDDFDTNGISSVNISLIDSEREVMFSDLFGKKNLVFAMDGYRLQKQMNNLQRMQLDSLEIQLASQIVVREGKRRRLFRLILKVLHFLLAR